MAKLNERLADRLKQLRLERGLPLQELADLSGVSRSTLSRIENGDVSPTADTLSALSAAYHMTISQLLAPVEVPFQPLVRHGEQSEWQDPENGFARRVVSPPSGGLSAEVIRCTLEPYQIIAYAGPSRPGHEHHLVMLEGALTVTLGDEMHPLQAGDCLRYQLYGPSRFQTGVDPATYLMVLV
ncbi:helix-turn-helix transcriptional regulator [uncultured Hoeflea sp.]|uniref:helix-turn-helix domain-containing protein n=1 Tax=uncultured Hoeflea sp. TaxID=538666 RepID=UPI0026096471|nr:helix-turn-helix transcriptional regulator [uncultured Hoeflea sp.]